MSPGTSHPVEVTCSEGSVPYWTGNSGMNGQAGSIVVFR